MSIIVRGEIYWNSPTSLTFAQVQLTILVRRELSKIETRQILTKCQRSHSLAHTKGASYKILSLTHIVAWVALSQLQSEPIIAEHVINISHLRPTSTTVLPIWCKYEPCLGSPEDFGCDTQAVLEKPIFSVSWRRWTITFVSEQHTYFIKLCRKLCSSSFGTDLITSLRAGLTSHVYSTVWTNRARWVPNCLTPGFEIAKRSMVTPR